MRSRTRGGKTGARRLVCLLVLFLFPLTLPAQEIPDERHRFWDRSNLVRFGVNAGAQTLDAFSTQHALNSGKAREFNPLARPFVNRGWNGQAVYSYGLGVALPVGLSYIAHRKGWHKLERATPVFFAAPSGVFGALNFRF